MFFWKIQTPATTVDGRNPANQLRLVVYHIIYKVLHIPGGAGFLPSTVCEMKAVLLQYKIFAPFESFWTQDSSAAAIAADFAAEYVPWRLFMIETQCIGV